MLTATKRFTFCYGHHLPGHRGKCSNMHGHNAVLEVTVKGTPDSMTNLLSLGRYEGMVVDFSDLKEIVNAHVLRQLDHQYIDPDIWGFVPTAENLALWIFWRLHKLFHSHLVKIKLSETEGSWVEVHWDLEIIEKVNLMFSKRDTTCCD